MVRDHIRTVPSLYSTRGCRHTQSEAHPTVEEPEQTWLRCFQENLWWARAVRLSIRSRTIRAISMTLSA
jgi:hypothetical protein